MAASPDRVSPGRTARKDWQPAPVPPSALRLRLLGGIDLRDASGAEIRPVLQQPKRLALLAALGLTATGSFRRRDSLLGMFWPELDQEHARGALRRSLYFLRRACGDGVIISRGEEEVGIAEGSLWCDALAFEEAVEGGAHAQALELYRGDLADGLYVAGAAGMQQWLDTERDRLRQMASRSAWALSEVADGFAGTLHWARAAMQLTPHDERGLRRLLGLLRDSGDTAGARRTFQEFTTRLQRDLELEPSSETREFAASLKGGPSRPRVDQPAIVPRAPAATPIAENVLAVCTFAVRGARELDYLGEGMIDLLSNALDGAGDLRIVDPRAVLAVPLPDISASGDGELNAIAEAVGAGRFVTGSVIRAGTRIRIVATLHRTGDGTIGRVTAEVAVEGELFGAVDEVARGIVGLLNQAPGTYPALLASRTSASWPAIKAFLQGEHEFRLGRHVRAMAAFEQAVQHDPTFALAHYRLAGTRAAAAMIEAARAACRTARMLHGTLAPGAQAMIEAQDAWLNGRLATAEQRYAAIVAEHPDNVEAWYLLGDVLFHGNPCRGRSPVEARPALQRALSLDAGHIGALSKLARIAAMEGEDAAVDLYVDRVVALNAGGDQSLALQAMRAFRRGDMLALMRLAGEFRSSRMFAVGLALADAAIYSGATSEVAGIVRDLLGRVPSTELRALGHLFLAEAALAQRDTASAERAYEIAGELDPAWALTVRALRAASGALTTTPESLGMLQEEVERWNASAELPRASLPLTLHDGLHQQVRAHLAGLLSARRGDAADIARWSEELAELAVPPGGEALIENMLRMQEASLRVARGDSASALHALEGARTEPWFQYAMASPVFAGVESRLLRADLLVAAGRPLDAAGWLESIGWHSVWELGHRSGAWQRASALRSTSGGSESDVTGK